MWPRSLRYQSDPTKTPLDNHQGRQRMRRASQRRMLRCSSPRRWPVECERGQRRAHRT
jgi:hypothetical protein